MLNLADEISSTSGGDSYEEYKKCRDDVSYFINTYIKIYDNVSRSWISFRLWAAQQSALEKFSTHQKVVILKARQEGFTWLCLSHFLHAMLFHPMATVLLFSADLKKAVDLLDYRLKGMADRLPLFLQPPANKGTRNRKKSDNSKLSWELSNGSIARSFSSTGGDGQTGTHALIDEADLVENLQELMGRVGPTVEQGGQLILLSRSEKSKPGSHFKNIYTAAKAGDNDFHAIFLSVFDRPDRTQEWYDEKAKNILATTGSLDEMYEQFPRTDTEALASNTADILIPPLWIDQCFIPADSIHYSKLPIEFSGMPSLIIYKLPEDGHRYVISADPAEGKETSNDSVAMVWDTDNDEGKIEEVAIIKGKIQTHLLGDAMDVLGRFYNNADLFHERNNMGSAVTLWLNDNSELNILPGLDGQPGWQESSRTKTILYEQGMEGLREKQIVFHTYAAKIQLLSIMKGTMKAPEGKGSADDIAITVMLGYKAAITGIGSGTVISVGSSRYLGRGQVIKISDGVDLIMNELERVKQKRIA